MRTHRRRHASDLVRTQKLSLRHVRPCPSEPVAAARARSSLAINAFGSNLTCCDPEHCPLATRRPDEHHDPASPSSGDKAPVMFELRLTPPASSLCLGLQYIWSVRGGRVAPGRRAMHGRRSYITLDAERCSPNSRPQFASDVAILLWLGSTPHAHRNSLRQRARRRARSWSSHIANGRLMTCNSIRNRSFQEEQTLLIKSQRLSERKKPHGNAFQSVPRAARLDETSLNDEAPSAPRRSPADTASSERAQEQILHRQDLREICERARRHSRAAT